MADETPLDRAHAAMQAAPDDDAARLRFYERVADAELFLLLAEEAEGENISPELFEVEDGRFVLAFDLPERLVQFAGRPAPYAALSGRVLSRMLAGQGIGLGLNLDAAPSSILVPAQAMDWLNDMLGHAPDEVEARIAAFAAPAGLPEAVIAALDAKLASAGGLARAACLAGVTYSDGGTGHLLAFLDAVPGARSALAKAAAEVLAFSGLDQAEMDVGFLAADDPAAVKMQAVGLRFDLPEPQRSAAPERAAPGSDPDRPPILR